MFKPLRFAITTTLALALLAASGCGGDSPPSAAVRTEIENILKSGEPADHKINSLSVEKWQKADGPHEYMSTFSLKLRLNEPLGVVVDQIGETNVVKTIIKKGDEVPLTGRLRAQKLGKTWEIDALPSMEGFKDVTEQARRAVREFVPGPGSNPTNSFSMGRNTNLRPLSKLGPLVEAGSAEEKKLRDQAAERQRAEIAAAEARLKVEREAAAERARLDQLRRQQEYEAQLAANAERQRQFEEQRRLQAEQAAERQRQAEEDRKQQAESARKARLQPFIQPLASLNGAVLSADAGSAMGMLFYDVTVNEEAFTATGKGVDFREMPFREFTFEAAVSERAVLSIKSSVGAASLEFNRASPSGVSGAPGSLSSLDPAERAKLDQLLMLGKRLAAQSPHSLSVESLTADQAKTRPADLTLHGIPGTIIFRGRVDQRVAPLFAGDVSRTNHAWAREVLSIRLPEPARASGLYIRGGNGKADNLLVIINGVHRSRVESIAPHGAAVVPLPPGLEILDLRFEALGAVQSRGIALIQ